MPQQIKPVRWQVLVKVVEAAGWSHERTKGDQMVFTKEGFARPVIIPRNAEIQTSLIFNNMRTAGLTREDYLALLENL